MNFETIINQVDAGLMPVVQQPDTLTPNLGQEMVGTGALYLDEKRPLVLLPMTEMAANGNDLMSSSQLLIARTATPLPLGETTALNQLLGQPDHNQLVGDLNDDALGYKLQANAELASTQTRNALQATASPAHSPLRLEAEGLTLTTYRIESRAIASGSKLVSLLGGKSGEFGKVSGTFTGATGNYNVVLGYYDETDGTATLEARIDGKTVSTLTLDQKLGSTNVSKGNLVRRIIAAEITLTQGTSFELLGTENGKEHARIDYIEFVPASDVDSPTPLDIQAPTARLTAASITTKGGTSQTFTVTYTDNVGINDATLNNTDLRVTGPNNFNQLPAFVSSSGSGTSRTATYRINAPGGSWDAADNGVYSVAVQANQVRDPSGNAVSSRTLGSFTVSVATPPPPTGGGKTYFEDDFSNGYAKTWKKESANLSHSIQTTKAPDGSDAIRFEVRRTDPNVALSKRSELRLSAVAAGSEQWYGFRVMLPQGWDRDPGSYEVVGQWHEVPDWNLGEGWRSPPLGIYVRDGQWRVNNKWDAKPKTIGNTPEGKATLWAGAYETGKWANWVFHVKWSHKSDGILQVWKDGQLIVDKKGPNTYNDQVGPYFKIGVYKPDWKENPQASNTDKRVLYFDQVRIGDNNAGYSAVTPG